VLIGMVSRWSKQLRLTIFWAILACEDEAAHLPHGADEMKLRRKDGLCIYWVVFADDI